MYIRQVNLLSILSESTTLHICVHICMKDITTVLKYNYMYFNVVCRHILREQTWSDKQGPAAHTSIDIVLLSWE